MRTCRQFWENTLAYYLQGSGREFQCGRKFHCGTEFQCCGEFQSGRKFHCGREFRSGRRRELCITPFNIHYWEKNNCVHKFVRQDRKSQMQHLWRLEAEDCKGWERPKEISLVDFYFQFSSCFDILHHDSWNFWDQMVTKIETSFLILSLNSKLVVAE